MENTVWIVTERFLQIPYWDYTQLLEKMLLIGYLRMVKLPFQYDKIKHFIAGFMLSIFGIFWFPLILLGVIFAFGKENYDYKYGGNVDFNDFLATVIGSIVAVIIVLLF